MNNIDSVYAYVELERARGADIDAVLEALKAQGVSIVDSIKVVRKGYNLSLGEAKMVVTGSKAWSREAKEMDALHQVIVDAVEGGD